jgi:hypothetical protein
VLHSKRTAATALLAAIILGTLGVRATAEAPAGQPVDGIRCDQMEGSVFHIHQHLSILAKGKAVPIPADIGRPVAANCLYWLHTHTSDGLIHVESPAFRTFTLGQFFDIWGEPLSATNVAGTKLSKGQLRVYVDGALVKGSPRAIELTQHSDIVLEAGAPYHVPVPFNEWNGQ